MWDSAAEQRRSHANLGMCRAVIIQVKEDEEEQGQEDRDKSKDEEDESKEQEDESKDQGTRSKKHSSLF